MKIVKIRKKARQKFQENNKKGTNDYEGQRTQVGNKE